MEAQSPSTATEDSVFWQPGAESVIQVTVDKVSRSSTLNKPVLNISHASITNRACMLVLVGSVGVGKSTLLDKIKCSPFTHCFEEPVSHCGRSVECWHQFMKQKLGPAAQRMMEGLFAWREFEIERQIRWIVQGSSACQMIAVVNSPAISSSLYSKPMYMDADIESTVLPELFDATSCGVVPPDIILPKNFVPVFVYMDCVSDSEVAKRYMQKRNFAYSPLSITKIEQLITSQRGFIGHQFQMENCQDSSWFQQYQEFYLIHMKYPDGVSVDALYDVLVKVNAIC